MGINFEVFEVTAAEFADAHIDSWQAESALDHFGFRSNEGILAVNYMALISAADCASLAGHYYWFCEPGCLPDGAAEGPFDTVHAAVGDATRDLQQARDDDGRFNGRYEEMN